MFKQFCSVCGIETECYCSEHPAAQVESIYVRTTTLPAPRREPVSLPPAILPDRVSLPDGRSVQPVSKTHARAIELGLAGGTTP